MVYLAKKGEVVVHHTSREAMKAIDGIDNPDMQVSETDFEAASGLVRIIDGEIIVGKTQAEQAIETERVNLNAEQADLQAELADKDYKVVKAAEAGIVLAEADPDLHARREWCRNRINEIRTRLTELETA
jgi:hypothetical protein